MTPVVSIIIPIYNSAPYLAETINCALNQDWPNKEIILIDDGSTDDSLAIAKSFESECVKVFQQENKGGSSARNYGLREASGEYIQFLDADDLMPPDKISTQMPYLMANPNCLIGCRWIRFKDNLVGTFEREGPHSSLRNNLSPTDWLLQRHTMLLHCWLTPKKLIDKTGFWDEEITQNDDGEFFFRVVGKAKQVLFTDKTIVYYRSGISGSVSTIKSEKKYLSEYLTALTYKEVVNQLTSNIESKIQVGNFFKKLVYEMYPNYKDLIELCEQQEEYKYADLAFKKSGYTGFFSAIIGWERVKVLKHILGRLRA